MEIKDIRVCSGTVVFLLLYIPGDFFCMSESQQFNSLSVLLYGCYFLKHPPEGNMSVSASFLRFMSWTSIAVGVVLLSSSCGDFVNTS